MDISIVIPTYSGGEIIIELFNKIKCVLQGNYKFEIIFVFDNGSVDTWEIIRTLKNGNPNLIKAYYLAKNYGQHRAIQFGLTKADGEFIITMDEDFQHDPDDILKLIAKQKEGEYDVVYGKFNNLQHQGIRNWESIALRRILKHFIPSLFDNYSPYRLIKNEIAKRASLMICPYTFIDDYLSRVTKNIAFEMIDHHKRPQGKSSYTFVKLLLHGLYILLAYSGIIIWMLTLALIFIFSWIAFYVINHDAFKADYSGLLGNNFIDMFLAAGGFLIFLSLLGALINHNNTLKNTRQVILIDKKPG